MPFPQLLTSVIENSANALLSLDDGADKRFAKLAGKQVRVHLLEMPFALRFCFADKVIVMAEEPASTSPYDVSIAVSIWSLGAMKDSSQLPRMIKSEQLQLDGDLAIAQKFSALFDEMSIDWEELLSQRVGDVAAYHISSAGRELGRHLVQLRSKFDSVFKDAALEEKQVAAHPLLVERFVEDVHALDAQVEKLAQRINKLEN